MRLVSGAKGSEDKSSTAMNLIPRDTREKVGYCMCQFLVPFILACLQLSKYNGTVKLILDTNIIKIVGNV